METQKYSIGEFSRRTGISIRTLHYYDDIGLLIPEKHPSSGHRLYKNEDLATLQKIISLKFLGYRLDKIGDMMKEPSFTVDLNETLTLHMRKLEEEKAIIEESIVAISRTIKILEEEWEINSFILMSLISSMQTERRQKEWLEKNQLGSLANLFDNISEEEKTALEKEFIRVSKELKRLYGKPIQDSQVQKYVGSYIQETIKFLGEETVQQLGNLELDEEKVQEFEDMVYMPFTKEEEEWVYQAVEYYLKQKGMYEPTDE